LIVLLRTHFSDNSYQSHRYHIINLHSKCHFTHQATKYQPTN